MTSYAQRRPGRGLTASLLLVITTAVACSTGVMQPCAGQPDGELLCPTRGAARVVVTGFEDWTFEAPLDTETTQPRSQLSLTHGLLQLSYRDRARLPADSFTFYGARTTTGSQQVGARILIHGSGYTTADGCTVTLTSFDEQAIEGSFTCTGMAPLGLEGSDRLIDASGTFSASP